VPPGRVPKLASWSTLSPGRSPKWSISKKFY
jgi:hypothetical protein